MFRAFGDYQSSATPNGRPTTALRPGGHGHERHLVCQMGSVRFVSFAAPVRCYEEQSQAVTHGLHLRLGPPTVGGNFVFAERLVQIPLYYLRGLFTIEDDIAVLVE